MSAAAVVAALALLAPPVPTVPPVRCAPPPAVAEHPGSALAARLRLPAAHALATGRGQRLVVIDTGVAPHPRLAGRLSGLGDVLAGGDGLDDCDGHGTAVAGLIGAAPDPGDGLVGVAPGARILALRQFSPTVAGADGQPAGDLPSLATALRQAVDAGATVVNVSGAVCLPAAAAAAAGSPVRAALRAAAAADVVVVAAAGNTGSGGCTADRPDLVSLPGWYGDDVLTVGAVGPDDRPAEFTVRGPWVDVGGAGHGRAVVDRGRRHRCPAGRHQLRRSPRRGARRADPRAPSGSRRPGGDRPDHGHRAAPARRARRRRRRRCRRRRRRADHRSRTPGAASRRSRPSWPGPHPPGLRQRCGRWWCSPPCWR